MTPLFAVRRVHRATGLDPQAEGQSLRMEELVGRAVLQRTEGLPPLRPSIELTMPQFRVVAGPALDQPWS